MGRFLGLSVVSVRHESKEWKQNLAKRSKIARDPLIRQQHGINEIERLGFGNKFEQQKLSRSSRVVDLITWLACCCWQLCGAAGADCRRWRRTFGNRRSVVETGELEIGEGEGEALKGNRRLGLGRWRDWRVRGRVCSGAAALEQPKRGLTDWAAKKLGFGLWLCSVFVS